MRHIPYLVVGGGMTAAAAVKGIRALDPDGEISLFSAEPHPPYIRPPLSKGLWTGKKKLDQIWFDTRESRVDLHLACQVTRIDPQAKEIEEQDGTRTTYDQLLLATGGQPRRLPFDAPGVIYYRTLDDYQALRAAAEPGKTFAVIGGGFIGSEIGAALRIVKSGATIIFPEDGLGSRVFPAPLSQYLNDYYRKQGVEVLNGETITGIERERRGYRLELASGREIWADGVVAGIGLQPNTGLAEDAGLPVEDGIQVDEYLHAAQPEVFAAGDVANFYSPRLARRMRVEHEDNALTMGTLAGKNMARQALASENSPAGVMQKYHHIPYFYSDLFDLGYEAVGLLDSRLETVEDWQEPYRKGLIYYLEDGLVRGVLLWNVWNQLEAARNAIGLPLEEAAGQLESS